LLIVVKEEILQLLGKLKSFVEKCERENLNANVNVKSEMEIDDEIVKEKSISSQIKIVEQINNTNVGKMNKMSLYQLK
jgi:hypothetical protein